MLSGGILRQKTVQNTDLQFVTADNSDLPLLIRYYKQISEDELEEVVNRGSVILGYNQGELIGFIGEHLEGSMEILYVFPEQRGKGYATALQNHLINQTIKKRLYTIWTD